MPDTNKPPGAGHNSEVSGARIKSFLERVARLEEEKKATTEDIRDVYGEAKATGFDPKILRRLRSLQKTNREKLREEQDLLELYAAAAGIDLP